MPKSFHLLEKAALELGHVTMNWAMIENGVDALISELAHLDDQDVRNAFAGSADIRGKVQLAKGLAFIRKPDDDWFKAVIDGLDRIDNDLRPRRNGYIHARWGQPGRGLVRSTQKTKLLKPQSRQLVLETEQKFPVSIADMRKLNKEMQKAWFGIVLQLGYVMRKNGWVGDGPSPRIPFRQFLRLVKHVDLRKRGRLARQSRPRSSPA